MKIYEKTRSNIKPESIRFDEHSAWVCENISEIQTEDGIQYEYDMIQYTKEEYMLIEIQKNIASTDYIAMMTGVM